MNSVDSLPTILLTELPTDLPTEIIPSVIPLIKMTRHHLFFALF
jgi:hypothetical protein